MLKKNPPRFVHTINIVDGRSHGLCFDRCRFAPGKDGELAAGVDGGSGRDLDRSQWLGCGIAHRHCIQGRSVGGCGPSHARIKTRPGQAGKWKPGPAFVLPGAVTWPVGVVDDATRV